MRTIDTFARQTVSATILVLLLLSPTGLQAAGAKGTDKPELTESKLTDLAETIRNIFDMSKQSRPWPTMVILDQEGVMYPSYWCGHNAGGRAAFNSKVDMLEGDFHLGHEGAFSVVMTKAANKNGMYDKMPGGQWIPNLKERDWTFTIESIEGAAITDLRDGGLRVKDDMSSTVLGDTQLIVVQATAKGTVSIDGRSAPFSGPIRLRFMDVVSVFDVSMTFPFPGTALGLDKGTGGEGITAWLHLLSAASIEKPDPKQAGGVMDDILIPDL